MQLELIVVGLRLRLLLLLIVQEAIVVAHLNLICLQVGFIGLRVALNAKHLLANAEHLDLAGLRARKQSGAGRHLKHLVLVTKQQNKVFQLFLDQGLVGRRHFLSQRPDGFSEVGLLKKLLLQIELLLPDVQSLGRHADDLPVAD